MELDDGNTQDIDEDLYSRQIAVYGLQTMRRLFASNVLVSGMQGLGAEIAKNLILAGIKSITLHDEGTVDWWDLSGNFVLSENDIGMNRAEACVKKLQKLNYAVLVNNLPGKLTKEQLSNFQAVVFTASDLKTAIEFNHYCRNHQPCISFIKADINGLFGNVFCDFGPEFTVADVDGEEPHTGIIADISNDREALICCVKDEKLQFQDGDFVLFSEIHGMIELNDGKPKRIKECSPYSFRIEKDTTNFTQYVKGGCVTQVKQPKVLNFRPLQETLTNPKEFLLSDFSRPDHPPVLHLAFQALDEFLCQVGRFPIAGSEDDVQKFTSIAVIINEKCGDQKLQDIKPELLSDFAHGARADLSPMATMFGGIAAQEIVKACSGMFHPIFQLFYFDSIESLPKTVPKPRYREPFDTRYDAQISVFGYNFQTKLENTRAFIVGCGSLGCEFVKNLALMGVSCGTDGKLIVTDEDVIKKSNLSNQLLFTEGDIRKAKSIIAASKAKYINPDLQIKALQHRVGPETENVFDITFWEDQNVVISAVDNTDSRIYVDQRCVLYRKPLLESGTMGAKCSTQMVIPDFTEHYGASTDPLEKQVPECNLKNFPYNINHCLKWALKEFEDLIEKPLHEVNTYISYPLSYTSALRKTRNSKSLEIILNCLEMERCDTFQDCITWARVKFEDCFTNQVKELILKYPEDLKTESGTSFWSPPKRFPRPLAFNLSDQSHICFVLSASILRAEIFGISIPEWVNDSEKISEAVDRVIVPDFQPNQDDMSISMKIDTDATSYIDQLIQKIEQCTQSLPSCIRLKHTHFYKDDNNSYETDFIAGLANMRARNYNIPEVDKLTAKVIAGKIIPKISTCTAMATGLVCLELYKVIDEDHFCEDYRNTFANLALPFFSMAEPLPPKKNYNFRHDSQL